MASLTLSAWASVSSRASLQGMSSWSQWTAEYTVAASPRRMSPQRPGPSRLSTFAEAYSGSP